MRCDQCKHWKVDTEPDWTAERVGFRRCMAVRERWRIEEGENIQHGSKWTADDPAWKDYNERRYSILRKARAYVQDGSEYMADLYTGPDFFCALFEASPPIERGS